MRERLEQEQRTSVAPFMGLAAICCVLVIAIVGGMALKVDRKQRTTIVHYGCYTWTDGTVQCQREPE